MPDAATCILCPPGRDRIPERPPVDNACRAGLPRLLADIRIMAGQLAEPDDLVPDRRLVTKSPRDGWIAAHPPRPKWLAARLGTARDPVAAGLPSGARGVQTGEAPVSGSRHPPLPIVPDRVDLTLWARAGSRPLFARGVLGTDPDQIGHMGLRTAVDTWVRDWAGRRRESLPPAHLPAMLRWMAARTDWACDHHPDVAAWAAEMAGYRATMRHLLGLVEVPDHKIGVSCPACRKRSLYRENGEWYIQCAECPQILSPAEYLRRTKYDVACPPCVSRFESWFAARRRPWREPYSCYWHTGETNRHDGDPHLTR